MYIITVVTNKETKEHYSYNLPPEKAVVVAHERSLGNWDPNLYDYDNAVFYKNAVRCGDWWAELNDN